MSKPIEDALTIALFSLALMTVLRLLGAQPLP